MAGTKAEAGMVFELVSAAAFVSSMLAFKLVPALLLGLIAGVRFVVVLVDDMAAVLFELPRIVPLAKAVPFGNPKIVPLMRAVPFGNSQIGWGPSLPPIDDVFERCDPSVLLLNVVALAGCHIPVPFGEGRLEWWQCSCWYG